MDFLIFTWVWLPCSHLHKQTAQRRENKPKLDLNGINKGGVKTLEATGHSGNQEKGFKNNMYHYYYGKVYLPKHFGHLCWPWKKPKLTFLFWRPETSSSSIFYVQSVFFRGTKTGPVSKCTPTQPTGPKWCCVAHHRMPQLAALNTGEPSALRVNQRVISEFLK